MSDEELRYEFEMDMGEPDFGGGREKVVVKYRKSDVDIADVPHLKAVAALKAMGGEFGYQEEGPLFGGLRYYEPGWEHSFVRDRDIAPPTRPNEETLKHLQALKNLRSVFADGMHTEWLLNLPDLEFIAIVGNNFTDADLMQLAKLRKLYFVEIDRSKKVTEEGAKRFMATLPDRKVRLRGETVYP